MEMADENAGKPQSPRDCMEQAARGMSDEDLLRSYRSLNGRTDRTPGQEEAFDVIRRELARRGIPQR